MLTKKELLEIKKEVTLNYMDLAGMVTVDRNPGYNTTGNGLMHLGFTTVLYFDLGIIDLTDIVEFDETVKSCQDEDNPGAFDRYPAVGDKPRIQNANGHDDARGVVAGSKVCRLQYHEIVYKEGLKRFFYYNNTNGREPGLWAWRIRMVVDIMWYFALNSKLFCFFFSPILKLILRLKNGTTGYSQILDYLIVTSMAVENKNWQNFRSEYLKKSKLMEATSEYFKSEHPLVKLAQEVQASAED